MNLPTISMLSFNHNCAAFQFLKDDYSALMTNLHLKYMLHLTQWNSPLILTQNYLNNIQAKHFCSHLAHHSGGGEGFTNCSIGGTGAGFKDIWCSHFYFRDPMKQVISKKYRIVSEIQPNRWLLSVGRTLLPQRRHYTSKRNPSALASPYEDIQMPDDNL